MHSLREHGPSIIDNEILQEAILKQYAKTSKERKLYEEDRIDETKVYTLKLSYKRLLRIENLWPFVNLETLQLDNNCIEVIEGLTDLVNLESLDLSFNQIEKIEGLETLVNLQHLSLFQNRIKTIEKLENLSKLKVFSIGNNLVSDFENVIYLKCLKQLQSLNIDGNPLTESPNYKLQTVAILPRLKYLNYKYIDQEMQDLAVQAYPLEREAANEEIGLENEKELEAHKKQESSKLYKEAIIDLIEGKPFFDALFSDDDSRLLLRIPSAYTIVDPFQTIFLKACEDAFKAGMQAYEERDKELQDFIKGTNLSKSEARSASMKKIKEFIEVKQRVFSAITEAKENKTEETQEIIEQLQEEFQKECVDLFRTLMKYEVDLREHMEVTIKEFERNITEMVSQYLEKLSMFMHTIREYEEQFSERMRNFSGSSVEKFLKNQLLNVDPDLEIFLVNRHNIERTADLCHELRVEIIDQREASTEKRLKMWLNELIAKVRENEITRHRKRLMEIIRFKEVHDAELQELCPPAVAEDATEESEIQSEMETLEQEEKEFSEENLVEQIAS